VRHRVGSVVDVTEPDAPAATGPDAQRLLRRGAAAPLARDVIVVDGPDAETFLQGQLSCDVTALAATDGAWSLLLAPNGKVVAWLRVSRFDSDQFVLDVDAGYADAVVARLERFKLRTKATITVAEPGQWTALAIRGPGQVELDHEAGSTVLTLPAPWPAPRTRPARPQGRRRRPAACRCARGLMPVPAGPSR